MRPITEEEILSGLDAIKARKVRRITPVKVRSYTPTEAATEALQRDWLWVASEGEGTTTMRQVTLAVATVTGVKATEIRSPRRNTRIVRARFMCFWLSRKLTSCSFPQIGRFTGNKDHTTVMHGIKRVVEDRDYFEPELSQAEAALKAAGGAP